MKKIISKIAFVSILIAGLISCEDNGYEEYKKGNTPSVAMNGEWYIDISDESGDILVQHAMHKTFDANDGKMYINDAKLGWWLKGKLNVNPTDLTFNVTKEANLNDPGTTFTITEGKIIKNAAKSKTGVMVDSIYFVAEFSYDPGVKYIHAGHRRTGFLEDDF
ncbi:lipid-binding protein [Flavobacterium eburneipallidum]|uniref:lipid-binding protein n=1 Tax=Flavobacterium eburneipallidum TaxID=3003263 RepID=UPI0022AC040D|nr:lipid-binding protein [Flavobacterium eburneipallidum]